MNKYYDKKGMSMGEVLIAMAILGVLVILLMPSLRGAQPDKNEVLHNKATHIVDTIFTDIKTDPRLYPKLSLSDTSVVKFNGRKYSGVTKFCELFASRLNLKSGSEINCKADEKTLTTVEGIDWYLPVTNFTGGNSKIMIDVNGDKEPNCLVSSEGCEKPDRYEYFLGKGNEGSSCNGIEIGGRCYLFLNKNYEAQDTCDDKDFHKWVEGTESWYKEDTAYCESNYWVGAVEVCIDAGMRLPSKDELDTLFINHESSPIDDPLKSNIKSGTYWTSTYTTKADAYVANFNISGSAPEVNQNKSTKNLVLCVKPIN